MLGRKRVLVITYTIEYLREFLGTCKKRGFNEERFIVLTSDPSVPRNFVGILAKHPKKLDIDKLSRHYKSLKRQLAITDNNFKRKEELEHEASNRKKQIKQLHDQITKESFADVDAIFSPRENIDDTQLMYFQPDVQMIVNAKFYDKKCIENFGAGNYL